MKTALAALLAVLGSAAMASGPGARGLYVFGHEVETFQPCRSKQVFWLTGPEAALKPVREWAEKKRLAIGKPYQPIYVELNGRVDRQSNRDGFAANYDGIFHLAKVEAVSPKVPETCPRS